VALTGSECLDAQACSYLNYQLRGSQRQRKEHPAHPRTSPSDVVYHPHSTAFRCASDGHLPRPTADGPPSARSHSDHGDQLPASTQAATVYALAAAPGARLHQPSRHRQASYAFLMGTNSPSFFSLSLASYYALVTEDAISCRSKNRCCWRLLPRPFGCPASSGLLADRGGLSPIGLYTDSQSYD